MSETFASKATSAAAPDAGAAAGADEDGSAAAVAPSLPADAPPRFGPLGRIAAGLGQQLRIRFEILAELFESSLRVLKSVWRHRRGHSRLLVTHVVTKQILFTGVHALWLITQVAVLLGVVFGVIVTVLANAELGGSLEAGLASQWAPRLQLLLIELATTVISPMIITLIVIARSGTAITSEIALMRIRGETSAIKAMGIDLDHFVVWPRILGMIVSTICLTIFFTVVLIAAHFVVVNAFAISESVRSLGQIERASQMVNLVQAVLKTGLIGAGIALIACTFGMKVRRAATEVPQAATRAVVNAIVFSVLANVVIFVIFYLLFGFAALRG